MPKQRKSLAMIACLFIVFALVFSAVFIVAEANHDCTGEHCPICYEIQICQQTIKAIGTISLAVAIICMPAFFLLIFTQSFLDCGGSNTPVSLKVKLTD